MKLICTGDWHLGNMFHGNDRAAEHRHFLNWLLDKIKTEQPDALLIAGDVFDNGNPSAIAQSLYYGFLADLANVCPGMATIVIAGNHDSANRLEAPRSLLTTHGVEVRGQIHRNWTGDSWEFDFDDLIIPLTGSDGMNVAVLAMPFLRGDMLRGEDYSNGVRDFISKLLSRAKELYPGHRTVLMAHLYATGAEIAGKDASEKIIIGGQEQVSMGGLDILPDYFTSGHIHKRQQIRGLEFANYSGSVLPMSFAEKDYTHGVDMVTITADGVDVTQLVYTPTHRLVELPYDNSELSLARLKRLIKTEIPDRRDNQLSDSAVYLSLKVSVDKIKPEDRPEIDEVLSTKDAILCKIQRIVPQVEQTTLDGKDEIHDIDDILNRDPMETLDEAFSLRHKAALNEHQREMLRSIINSI